MEEEKQLGAIEQKVPLENTRPVSDPDEILQLLNELLKRTEAMETRLDCLLQSDDTDARSNGSRGETEGAMDSSWQCSDDKETTEGRSA